MGGASLVGRLVTGWLVDRFFAARVSFALLMLAALGTFVLAVATLMLAMPRYDSLRAPVVPSHARG